MHLRRSATAILAVASLFTLAACGGSGDSDANTPIQTQGAGGGAGTGKNPDAQGPLEVPGDAASGGTVTVDTVNVPATLDPTRAYYTDSTAILNLVTRALTQYAYNPETQDMELVPDMATDLGTHNKDMTEWTFTLKDGLKYEDGSDVKAEDIAYAIERSFAIEELPDGPTYQLQFFQDGDKYKGPFTGQDPLQGRDRRREQHHDPHVAAVPGHGLLRLLPDLHRASRRPRTPRRSTATTRWPPVPTCSRTTSPARP